ncbi:MAG: bifunctional metallophosphatase/5'-nucleotidase [Prevotella sp.]|nr:bifunctional metallophosphatase/5'-nucleotidase [Prevotella sp.]
MNKPRLWMQTAILSICGYGLLLSSCSLDDNPVPSHAQKSIVIIFENDVHCAIDGYKRIAGLRDAIGSSDTAWAAAVSCGDYLQGGSPGALSRGAYIATVMSTVGYDVVTLGNHEFDYGTPRLLELVPMMNTDVVCANFYETATDKPVFAPYTLKRYGDKTVGFVGATTPDAMTKKFAFFDTDGTQLYDMRSTDIYQKVQEAIDEVRQKGADYVVVLSHLGEEETKYGVTSHKLIAATRGIDVLLDGHTHSVVPRCDVADADGKLVPISQTGSQLANLGKLIISADGNISTTIVPKDEVPYENATVSEVISNIYQEMDKVTTRQVAHSDFELTVNDAEGNRMVRRGETNLGDIVTDAFKVLMNAEIGLCNGGGLRNSIKAGDITYGDVVNALPFDNCLVKIETKGEDILTMLTQCTSRLPAEIGQFPHVSGMRYTIHTKSHTISDVTVFDAATSTWQPLDPERLYTIATLDYYNGGGFYDTLINSRLIEQTPTVMCDYLAEYLEKTLAGVVPADYAQSQGRITFVEN